MQRKVKLSSSAISTFLICFLLCSILAVITIVNRSNVESLRMEQFIVEKSVTINQVISKLLYKTEALSALVVQGDGEIQNFERVAVTILDDPSILNVILAPNGIVSNVYPLNGNEKVMGLDLFSEGIGNKEARLAKDTGKLVFGGPFSLIQGGEALVGRLPVYTYNNSEKTFWGLVSVTLKYPESLKDAELGALETQGYAYEIWRVNPDDSTRQVIASSNSPYDADARFIEKHMSILNADWYFRVAPVRMWYSYPETWVLAFCGLLISFLASFVVQHNVELKRMKAEIEAIARLDSLTGIFNRRYFMEAAEISMERAHKLNQNCFVVIFDLDNFKSINDTYGHLAGDKVLVEVVGRIKNMLRPYDLFCRYGGEEMLLMLTDIKKPDISEMVERLRKTLCNKAVIWENRELAISASFGIAQSVPGENIALSIKHADIALYIAKNKGRNQSTFYEPTNESSTPDQQR